MVGESKRGEGDTYKIKWREPLAVASAPSVSQRVHTSDCVKAREMGKDRNHTRGLPPSTSLSTHSACRYWIQLGKFACSCDPTAPLPGIEWRAVCVCVGWCVCVRRAASSAPAYQSVSIATSKKSLAGMRTLRLRGALPSWPRSKLSDSGWL